MQGRESLQLYNKAVEIILKAIQNQQSAVNGNFQSQGNNEKKQTKFKSSEGCDKNEASSPVVKQNENASNTNLFKGRTETLERELSNTYCAVAELWMTDLCDESEAENECASSINKAVESDNSNPEAWQTKARLHLVKSEFNVSLLINHKVYYTRMQFEPIKGANFNCYPTHTLNLPNYLGQS